MEFKHFTFLLLIFASYVAAEQESDEPFEIIDVPDNCPEGQHIDINGECVDGWGRKSGARLQGAIEPNDIIDVPNNCPEGQLVDINGNCVDSWGRKAINNKL